MGLYTEYVLPIIFDYTFGLNPTMKQRINNENNTILPLVTSHSMYLCNTIYKYVLFRCF